MAILTLIGCLLAFTGGPARLLADDLQSWHRVSLSAWQQGEWEAQLATEGRWHENRSRLHEYFFTPQLFWRPDQTWELGVSYTRYSVRNATGFDAEHRWDTEINPRWNLADWVQFDLRNRLEIRFREGPANGTERTRHRMQFNFPVRHAGPLQSLFVNNEFFYDVDRNQLNQNRLVPLGLKFKLNDQVQLRVFYLLQSVRTRADWDHAHVLGTHLHFRLH